tara:strand:+ start:2315 stop:4861 length:2547 start_codon:yes stop_codon:yes gene_type:complete
MAIAKNSIEKPMEPTDMTNMLGEPDIEIEIEDPEKVTVGIGDMEIVIDPDAEGSDEFNANLAEEMSDEELSLIADDLLSDFNDDIASRKDWMQTYVDGLDLLGLKLEERTEPWPGACGVHHPLLTEALVKFQSETIMETFPARGPVKTQIIGEDTREKKEAANRVKADMNYQLTEKMVEFRPEHERMLWGLGLSGNAFKKVYYDPNLERQVSIFVPAEDMVVPYGASDLETAERVTHVMRKTENDLKKLQVSGFYRDVDLGDSESGYLDDVEKKIAEKMGFSASYDDRYKILEMHVNLDLAGYEDKDKNGKETGIALPYIVTLEKSTGTVLAVRRNYQPDDDLKEKRNHFVHYGYVPGFGFYNFGLIHLVGAFAKSGTSLIRQLVDAGTLSNLPGGFKTKGLRVKGDDTPIGPAEFRDVDVPSGSIKDNIMTLPYKEPSQVLYTLLGTIVDEGRRFASAADLKISDMSAQSPVGTTLAILERSLKVMSAVQARVHYSMRQEFKLLKDIIRDYTPDKYNYDPENGSPFVKRSDYDMVEVLPVSDPNSSTMAQKVVQYQAVMQMAQAAPQIYNMPQLHRQMLDVLGIKDAAKLVPLEDDAKPKDPLSENMDALKIKPMKAFIYQDHDAHILAHMNFLNDPIVGQLLAQNPKAKLIATALQSHVAEHLGFKYRLDIEKRVGAPLPKPNAELPEDMELEVSRLIAQASTQLSQNNMAQIAQQKAQQKAQDPIIQMQQQELALKAQDAQRKAQKDQADVALKQAQIAVEQERIASQERQAQMQTLAKAATEDAKLEEKQSSQVVKALVDEQKAENQADDAIARTILQQAMSQPKEPTPPMTPETPTPPEETIK